MLVVGVWEWGLVAVGYACWSWLQGEWANVFLGRSGMLCRVLRVMWMGQRSVPLPKCL